MDKIGEQQLKNIASHANKLPAEIVGRALQKLTVVDRLQCERVSPRWKQALSKWGWIEQKKLDKDIVFEWAESENVKRFKRNLDENYCHLVSLLHRCAPWIREFDLDSFGRRYIERFFPKIVESLQTLKKLEKLNIWGFNIADFVVHLPRSLLVVKTLKTINIDTLQKLADHCPNMEEVPFEWVCLTALEIESAIELIGKFPRQKKLRFGRFLPLRPIKQGALALIGQLKGLVELNIWNCNCFDEESLVAILGGCQQLRSLTFDTSLLNEKALFWLAEFPNLTALRVLDEGGKFTDSVLKAIAKRGLLKKLVVQLDGIYMSREGAESSMAITDSSIVYLVDHCKSLVSLRFNYCKKITQRSLEAVVAEVNRRHKTPPRSLPTGPLDPKIFYFVSERKGITQSWGRAIVCNNPWLIFGCMFAYDPREII